MNPNRRSVIGGATALGVSWALPGRAAVAPSFRPEAYGAKGDGIANDTHAFAAMAAAIVRAGSGRIILRKTTYLVGRQLAAIDPNGWAFPPAEILTIKGLAGPLTISGNGARLKCPAGLRYGTFDRRTGAATHQRMPNLDQRELASPYTAMLRITQCRGPILIEDLELDGSLGQLKIGGPFGDTGYQIPAIGLFLADNTGTETVRRLHIHHHGQDGIEIGGDDKRHVRSRFEDVRSEYNGRQGLSMIGGRGYDFVRCKFNHTGRSAVRSAPGAGVDIEAEGGKLNRDFTFTDCEFINNVGCGLVADSGDSADAKFTRCTFVGTDIWSAWPYKPGFVFTGCTFVGAVVHPFPSAKPAEATKFFNCRFLDDPRLSPTGRVYQAGENGGPMVNMAESNNVLFSHCTFLATHGAQLPWSWRAIYKDCTMVQSGTKLGYPKGQFLGRTSIVGKVDLYGSKVEGSLIVNGQPVSPGIKGGPRW